MNHFFILKIFELIRVQSTQLSFQYCLFLVQPVVFCCCDFIAQSILVRTADVPYHYSLYISKFFKDIPLLDCMELQYPRRDHSFNFSIGILRFVNLS